MNVPNTVTVCLSVTALYANFGIPPSTSPLPSTWMVRIGLGTNAEVAWIGCTTTASASPFIAFPPWALACLVTCLTVRGCEVALGSTCFVFGILCCSLNDRYGKPTSTNYPICTHTCLYGYGTQSNVPSMYPLRDPFLTAT